MALRKPKSPKEVRYFTRKTLGKKGKVMIWVFNPECPKCGKEGLRIPYNEKTGKFKSRSRSFVCMYCGHKVSKKKVKKEIPTANVKYTCPECGHKGELQKPFKRTKSTKVFKFKCQKCDELIRVGGKKK